jgi:dTMP kinase
MKKMFITFEGGEGTGKTTILDNLYKDLSDLGYKVVKTREPGGSKIAEQIRNIILGVGNTKMDYKAEALLFAASRSQHMHEVIRPSLEDGAIVLCDRYVDSSLAYQGYARGLGIEEVYQINSYAIGGVMPDLTVLIDVDPEIGLKRIKSNHRVEDRLDLETMTFHKRVREGYLLLAKRFPERIFVIDGDRTIEEVYQDVKTLVLKHL